jgi:nicotinamide-nucleotide amidase
MELQRITTSGDDIKKLAQIIRQSLSRSSVIITTGGLGPTQDDLTREAIALVLGEEMFTDSALVTELKSHFVRMGREMPPSNMQQAMRISSSTGHRSWLVGRKERQSSCCHAGASPGNVTDVAERSFTAA